MIKLNSEILLSLEFQRMLQEKALNTILKSKLRIRKKKFLFSREIFTFSIQLRNK